MTKSGLSKPVNDPVEYKEALNRAAALCSRKEQCSGHIREKLRDWGLKEEDCEKIIRHLQQEKFLDDHRFAGFFAKDKFRFNGWGKIKISYMLKQKGISEDAIGRALEQIGDTEYYRSCLEMIRMKSASLKEEDKYARKGKLYRFASGRGFEPGLIHTAIDEVEKEW